MRPVYVNLVPAALRMHAARRRRLTRWTLAVASSAALAAVAVGFSLHKQAQAAALRNEQRGLSAQLSETRAKLTAAADEGRRLKAEVQRADALRAKRCWSGMTGLVAACMPQEVWLTSMATDPHMPSAGAPVPLRLAAANSNSSEPVTMSAPTLMQLHGYALDHERLYEFMAALKQTGVFRSVELLKAGAEPLRQATAIRFQLTCGW